MYPRYGDPLWIAIQRQLFRVREVDDWFTARCTERVLELHENLRFAWPGLRELADGRRLDFPADDN